MKATTHRICITPDVHDSFDNERELTAVMNQHLPMKSGVQLLKMNDNGKVVIAPYQEDRNLNATNESKAGKAEIEGDVQIARYTTPPPVPIVSKSKYDVNKTTIDDGDQFLYA